MTTLRAWGATPDVSLVGLPVITETTFDPDTFNRVMERIHEAQVAFMARWSTRLSDGMGRARTPHELALELVRARGALQPRVELVTHPSLPEPVRSALRAGFVGDLANLQGQLEQNALTSDQATRTDRADRDRLLLVFKQNPMTSLLAPVSSAGVPGAPTASTRRIIVP